MTENSRPLKIALPGCFFHADPTRPIFKGKTLIYLEQSMAHWVQSQGAIPYLIPTAAHGFELGDFLDGMDGLVLQGGSDVCPRTYGEEPMNPKWCGDEIRDRYEIELIKECMKRDIPVLGICRGLQILNVALGGTLYQDIETQVPGATVHRDWEPYDQIFHEVRFEPGSSLERMYAGKPGGMINTVHHQAIKDLAPDLVVEAVNPTDNIIEAVRYLPKSANGTVPYVFGVQWHPEFVDPANRELLEPAPILKDFLDAVRARKQS